MKIFGRVIGIISFIAMMIVYYTQFWDTPETAGAKLAFLIDYWYLYLGLIIGLISFTKD